MSKICIDASVFIGLHSKDNDLRICCKNFFVENINNALLISFEQIGNIDNTIWKLPFEQQVIYFDFMDYFMTISNLIRKPYSDEIFDYFSKICGKQKRYKETIDFSKLLTLSFATLHKTTLYTLYEYPKDLKFNTKLLSERNLKNELKFEHELERKYQNSLKVTF